MLHYEFRWIPEKDKIQVEKEKSKGITYKVRISYKMFPEVTSILFLISLKEIIYLAGLWIQPGRL